jgi:hypothetical protein
MNNTAILSPERIAKASGIYETLKKAMPKTRDDLRNYLKVFLNINIGEAKICPEHDSPMDYLWHCFSSDFDGSKNGDCVVWAGRGGGKTYLAAIATLLDSIFKPGCKTRILAGSQAQAQKMYHYLLEFLRNDFEDFLAAPAGKNKCRFNNGSDVEVLAQSAASVRGSHIHKLRCDEVELFNRHIFESAKFITKSADGIISAMEMLSTMHHPFGIMHELIGNAQDCGTKILPIQKYAC